MQCGSTEVKHDLTPEDVQSYIWSPECDLKTRQRAVLAAVVAYMRPGRLFAYPSRSRIADATGQSVSTVKRALGDFRESTPGWLRFDDRDTETHVFEIIGRPGHVEPGAVQSEPPGAQTEPGGAVQSEPRREKSLKPQEKNTTTTSTPRDGGANSDSARVIELERPQAAYRSTRDLGEVAEAFADAMADAGRNIPPSTCKTVGRLVDKRIGNTEAAIDYVQMRVAELVCGDVDDRGIVKFVIDDAGDYVPPVPVQQRLIDPDEASTEGHTGGEDFGGDDSHTDDEQHWQWPTGEPTTDLWREFLEFMAVEKRFDAESNNFLTARELNGTDTGDVLLVEGRDDFYLTWAYDNFDDIVAEFAKRRGFDTVRFCGDEFEETVDVEAMT